MEKVVKIETEMLKKQKKQRSNRARVKRNRADSLNELIGKAIRAERDLLDMSRRDLAYWVGCHEQTIRNYETARSTVKIKHLIMLEQVLNMGFINMDFINDRKNK